MKNRSLTSEETAQLNITKLFHEKRLKEKFNWKKVVLALLLELLFIVIIYFFDHYRFSLIAKLGVVIVPFLIWSWVTNFKVNRKKASNLLRTISSIDVEKGINVFEYKCKKAIFFPCHEDEANCYALEVDDNKLLFWWDADYSYQEFLPNTKFELYEKEDYEKIFKRSIIPLGNKFQPITIRSEIKWELWGELPNHKEVISSNVQNFLKKLKKNYKKKFSN